MTSSRLEAECHREGRGVRVLRDGLHVVGFGHFMGFVDNKKNRENWQPCPLKGLINDTAYFESSYAFVGLCVWTCDNSPKENLNLNSESESCLKYCLSLFMFQVSVAFRAFFSSCAHLQWSHLPFCFG